MNSQDHYRVLGISPDTDQATIRAAYRIQMKRHHPDLNPGREDAHSIAASINLAYDVLSDPVSRSRYDRESRQTARDSRRHSSHTGPQAPRDRGRRRARTQPHGDSAQNPMGHGPQQRNGTEDTSSPATLSTLGRILWTLAIAVMFVIEILSVPATMIGIGAVLFVFGAFITAATAMNYIFMVLLGAPAVAFGVALIARNPDELPRVVGILITCAGVFLSAAGVYMTVTTAPVPVILTLFGAVGIGFAVRTGRAHGSFTSRRIHLVS